MPDVRYTAILWDVDGTLLDFLYAQRKSLVAAFKEQGMDIGDDIVSLYSAINDRYWKKLELSEVTRQELLIGRFRELVDELSLSDTISSEQLRISYEYGLSTTYKYIENSYEIVKKLFDTGLFKQYIITNGVASVQRGKLSLSGLTDYIEELFISEEVGAEKPQGAFFEYCCEHIAEKDKERLLVVGDSLTSDIRGANEYGIASVWYNPGGWLNESPYIPVYEIKSLKEVQDILGIL